jgi:hypothetical protein
MSNLPDYFNWKDYEGQDWTTPAKDQGYCGSCWDFAAVGALESVINIKEDLSELDPDLSEQYVLSCLPNSGSCNGGDPWRAYRYIFKNDSAGNDCNGIIFESCMPYQADHNIPCEEKCENWENYLVPITDYQMNWWLNHEESTLDKIKTIIIEGGPVAAGMNVTTDFYKWGLTNHDNTDYYPETHETWAQFLNHIIVIVGWKDDPSIGNGGYWICKNSWGESFGYDGFFNIEYGSLFTGWMTVWVEYNPEDYDWPPIPKINGPYYGGYYGLINEPVEFQGDAAGEHPPFTYHWDFGDDSTSEEQNPTHTYTTPSEYTVTLTVTDDNDNSFFDISKAFIQETNQQPNKPIIDGPTKVEKDEYFWCNVTFDDPDNSDVEMYFEAFGLETGWLGPYPPGGEDHIYWNHSEEGNYIFRAKARDPFGAESDWAILEIIVPKNKEVINRPILNFLQQHPNLFPILRQLLLKL